MLDKSKLRQILEEWSFWTHPPSASVPRQILSKEILLKPDLILVIQGVRRCGKSTLLSQIMIQKKLNPTACTFINFEDPRLSQDLTPELLDQIVNYSKKTFPNFPVYYFFLDEIQNVSSWEKWLHKKVERPINEVYIITGSNASLLSGELSTALTGRHLTIELFPFDFFEFQSLKKDKTFEDYLQQGGFPRVLTFERPQELLREYFNDIIERDVRRHVSPRSSVPLTQMIKAVFESAASEVSHRSLSKLIGVTPDTIKTYLDAACSAYILLECPYFTFSERQSAARNKKYYPIDIGFRKAIITQTGQDKGKDLETMVFHHLRKRYSRVFYWREKGEVDFVVLDKNEIIPYQVSWENIQKRHEEALKEFTKKYPRTRSPVIITRKNIESFLMDSVE